MAAKINYNEILRKYSFITRKEPGWHNLGKIFDGDLNIATAIKESCLDFPVKSGLAYCKYDEPINNIKGKLVANTRFTYREDTGAILMNSGRAVTDAYTIVQNIDAFDFFDNMLGTNQAYIETAGALGNGEIIFITARLEDKILIKKDVIDKYLLLTNSHDGSGSITVLFTNIRVVCNNTLNMALQSANNKYRIKHTKNAQSKLNDLAIMLKQEHIYSQTLQETLTNMSNVVINDNMFKHYVYDLVFTTNEQALIKSNNNSFVGIDEISTNKVNQLAVLSTSIERAPGQDIHRGTALWLYNGISSYISNVKNYKTEEQRFSTLLLNTNNQLNQKAFDLALNLS